MFPAKRLGGVRSSDFPLRPSPEDDARSLVTSSLRGSSDRNVLSRAVSLVLMRPIRCGGAIMSTSSLPRTSFRNGCWHCFSHRTPFFATDLDRSKLSYLSRLYCGNVSHSLVYKRLGNRMQITRFSGPIRTFKPMSNAPSDGSSPVFDPHYVFSRSYSLSCISLRYIKTSCGIRKPMIVDRL